MRGGPPRARPALEAWSPLLPALVAVVLSIPCLSLGYFWDDYYFLTFRGSGDPRAYLLPDPAAAFYRPISQGLYFLFLRVVDPSTGTLAHILNLATLASAVTILTLLVTRLAGRRAGLCSGLFLAGCGLVPGLVAWVSCSQDLLAVALMLAAFLLRHGEKNIGALACATAAVLCKEPAIAAFPVLVLWDPIVGRSSSRPRFQAVAYASVAIAWALIHPGLRLLAGRGFQSGATGYLGIENPGRWGLYLGRYAATLLNLPPQGLSASWWADRIPYGLAAQAILIAGLLLSGRRLPAEKSRPQPLPLWRVGLIAALVGLPTLLMPTILIRHWAPYFAFFPATALALWVGPLVARQRTAVAIAVLSLFLLAGVRYRGIRAEQEPVWTERLFVDAAEAMRTVRRNFQTVLPSLPLGSQVIASVSSTGARGIYSTLVEGQALRVWYRDPTLQTVTTLHRRPGASSEFLVRVTTELDVIWIDPDTRHLRATTRRPPELTDIGRPIVNYARAVAAAGDYDRAARIVESLAQAETGSNRDYVQRVCVMILLAAGRRDEASIILATLPPLPKEDALWSLKPFLTETSASERLDEAAFESFGVSATDPDAIRWLMQHFRVEGAAAQAAWYAERLLGLAPGDPEAIEVVRAAEASGVKPRRESAPNPPRPGSIGGNP